MRAKPSGRRRQESRHLRAGGKDVDATVVYGVKPTTCSKLAHRDLDESCTTNCLAPLAKVLNDKIGIVSG